MALTEAWLKSNNGKDREKEEVITDRDGLCVRVSPKGKITFVIRYRFANKPDKIKIGTYPYMSLKDARAKLLDVKEGIDKGVSPKTTQALALTDKDEKTFKEVFNMWIDKWCKEKKQSWSEIKRSFELHVFEDKQTDDGLLPGLGDLPAKALTTAIWLDRLEAIAEHSNAITERVLINAKGVYEWGLKREYFDANVVDTISGQDDLLLDRGARNRVFNDQEIYMTMLAARSTRMVPRNKLLFFLCLFYGCRVGELRLAKKSDFDLVTKIWTVPPENHKTGRITAMPLHRPIITEIEPYIKQLIECAGSNQYLFAGDDSDQPITSRFHLSIPSNIDVWLKRHRSYDIPAWYFHVLRKTCRTNMSTLAEPHICEIMLGHALPKMWRTYDFHDYLEEQAVGYKKWFERLTAIISNHSLDVLNQPKIIPELGLIPLGLPKPIQP